jgi:hypothetical protein
MTRQEALKNLNLSSSAGREEIEKAYRRLALRYPPEFHPERFRLVDESYRFLTSFAFFLESVLLEENREPDRRLFVFAPTLPESLLDDALHEARRRFLMDALWATGEGEGAEGKKP